MNTRPMNRGYPLGGALPPMLAPQMQTGGAMPAYPLPPHLMGGALPPQGYDASGMYTGGALPPQSQGMPMGGNLPPMRLAHVGGLMGRRHPNRLGGYGP